MPDQEYQMAIDLSRTIAAEVGTPRFYLEKAREVALSRELFAGEPLIAAGLRLVAERGACLGHGTTHVEKVAVDSGALILIEEGGAALMPASGGWSSWHSSPASSTTSAGRRGIMRSGEPKRRKDSWPDYPFGMTNVRASSTPSATMRPSAPAAPRPAARRSFSPTPSTMRTSSAGGRIILPKPSGR